ncbi:acylphosphatase [uncultured Roseivirga sp.]|uniref:acylphosphatase n=1 Tax=uncultured Roseivirga sp. TaxID=543088 RepID=UPI0032B1723E
MEMAISITVKGKVQGVFYRASCQKKAQALGVRAGAEICPMAMLKFMQKEVIRH